MTNGTAWGGRIEARGKDDGAIALLALITLLLHPAIVLNREIPLDSDTLLFFYPLRAMHADPGASFWNPYAFCGFPRDANPQAQLLYPPNLIFQWLSAPTGYAALLAGHLWLGAAFMYRFLRGLSLPPASALAGSVCFMAGTFWRCKITNLGLLEGIAWIPILLFYTRESILRATVRAVLLAGVFLALVILAGVPHTAVYCLILLTFTAAAHAGRTAAQRGRAALALMSIVGVAVLLTMGAWYPALLYSAETQRLSLPLDDALAGSLSWSEIWRTFMGGLTQPAISRHDPWEGTCYIGVSALMLVPFGWSRMDKRLRAGLAAAVLFAVLCSLGRDGLIFPLLHEHVPGWGFLNLPNRSLLMAAVALPVFAAFGYQRWIERETFRPRTPWTWLAAAAAMVLAAFAILLANGKAWISLIHSGMTGPFLPGSAGDSLWAVLNFCFWGSVTAAILFLLCRRLVRPAVFHALFLILTVSQSMHYSQRLFLQTTPPDYADPPATVAAIRKDAAEQGGFARAIGYAPAIDSPGDVRCGLVRDVFMHRLAELHSMNEIQGYDPMYPKRYAELVRAWSGVPRTIDPARIVRLDRMPPVLLDLLGVRYVCGYPNQQVLFAGNAVLNEPGATEIRLEEPVFAESVSFRWLLAGAANVPQNTVTGTVVIEDASKTVSEFSVAAGVNIANYMIEFGGRHANHRPADEFRWFPVPSRSGYAEIRQFEHRHEIDPPARFDRVRIESRLREGDFVVLQINAEPPVPPYFKALEDNTEPPVYRIEDAKPPVYIAAGVETYVSVDEIPRYFERHPSRENRPVFYHRDQDVPFADISKNGPGRAAVYSAERPEAGRWVVETRTDREGILVVMENHSPNWRATVDGFPAKTVRANHAFLSVPVPAGYHTVEMEYVPNPFYAGRAVGAIALALIALFFVRSPSL